MDDIVWGNIGSAKLLYRREADCVSRAAEPFGEQQPTIFGEIRKELAANRNDLDGIEVFDEIVEERRGIWGVPNRGGHDERDAAART